MILAPGSKQSIGTEAGIIDSFLLILALPVVVLMLAAALDLARAANVRKELRTSLIEGAEMGEVEAATMGLTPHPIDGSAPPVNMFGTIGAPAIANAGLNSEMAASIIAGACSEHRSLDQHTFCGKLVLPI